jgi:hypothetical protein
VPGRFEHIEIDPRRRNALALAQDAICRRAGDSVAEGGRQIQLGIYELFRIKGSNQDRACWPLLLEHRIAANMVAVPMSDENRGRCQRVFREVINDCLRLKTRINDDAFTAIAKMGDIGVFVEWGRDHSPDAKPNIGHAKVSLPPITQVV